MSRSMECRARKMPENKTTDMTPVKKVDHSHVGTGRAEEMIRVCK